MYLRPGSYSPARCLPQPTEAGPAGDREKPWPGGCCWVSWLSPPSADQLQGQILPHHAPALVLHRNGALWDFSSFPFHFGVKGSFSQLSSCRCSVGDNNRSRGFRGLFSSFVLSPTVEFCLILNSSEFCRLAKNQQNSHYRWLKLGLWVSSAQQPWLPVGLCVATWPRIQQQPVLGRRGGIKQTLG